MTALTTKLKSSKAPERCAALAFALVFATFGEAATQLPRLPVIQNVGTIPLQWEDAEGPDPELEGPRLLLEHVFPKAVHASRRFRVLGDDLVAASWREPAGRTELREEFELDAFVSLTATPRGDTLVLTARVMDGFLKTLLLETETLARGTILGATEEILQDRVDGLVFRLFNRLPVDVSVTSIQGSYITLSGGSDQGIQPGDQVDLIRTSIRAVHPANGTWLEFEKRPLGKAQVVEVKTYNSVAKLGTLVKENAVEVADGARIGAIEGRVKFQRLAAAEGFRDSGAQKPVIVPPLYYGVPPPPKPDAIVSSPAVAPPPKPVLADNTQGGDGTSGAPPQPAAAPSSPSNPDDHPSGEAPKESSPSVWDNVTTDVTSHRLIDAAHLYAGPYWWSVRGPTGANASGKFPVWLLNSLGGGIERTLIYRIKTAFGGGLLFGRTPAGTYMGYDSNARIYLENELFLADGLLKFWRGGGIATFSGMSVPQGSYGGGDWIRGGAFGLLGGSIDVGGPGGLYDWTGEFDILPMVIGRVGYKGTRKVVESALGWRLSLAAFKHEAPQTIQWGGGLDIGDERETLKNGQRVHLQDYHLKMLAKYLF